MKIKLSEILDLLEPLAIKGNIGGIVIEDFTDNSREVPLGSLFFAIKGEVNDGHNFLPDIENKVSAAVVEHLVDNVNCIQIVVNSSKMAYLKLLQLKHNVFLSDFSFIGITGTNGKTTFTYLMESILKSCGRKPAVIGTVNYRYYDYLLDAPNTTPDLKNLIPIFGEFKKRGCLDIVMEVSSHALVQRRLEGVKFDAVSFSNLTPEHLDYHKDMEDYYNAKKLLFTNYLHQNSIAVINIDDSYGRRLFNELNFHKKFGFSFKDKGNFQCRILEEKDDFMLIELFDGSKRHVVKTELKGRFNAYNVATAYITAFLMGYDEEKIKKGIFSLKRVPGRLEEVKNELGIKVFVDYAHTPDALTNILKTARELTEKRLILVFGCGGDRDRTKRPLMGKIACDYADIIVITSDNPRSEEPMSIIEDIKRGLVGDKKVIIQPDREKAIFEAICSARKNDTIIIAGKGHEDYQIIGNKKNHFSDVEIAKKAMEKRRCLEQH
ncbi:MAG: UDP-N-acetylmuramoyl-L-alanyl-D-glutamate--2,6-diaminopimelate ligase [bacterium]